MNKDCIKQLLENGFESNGCDWSISRGGLKIAIKRAQFTNPFDSSVVWIVWLFVNGKPVLKESKPNYDPKDAVDFAVELANRLKEVN